MAKTFKKKNIKASNKTVASPFKIYWTKLNYIYLFIGLFLIVAGFYAMSIGPWNSFTSLLISPVILVIGYVLVFPLSIFYRNKVKSTEEK